MILPLESHRFVCGFLHWLVPERAWRMWLAGSLITYGLSIFGVHSLPHLLLSLAVFRKGGDTSHFPARSSQSSLIGSTFPPFTLVA